MTPPTMLTWLTILVSFAWIVSILARLFKPELSLSFPGLDAMMPTVIAGWFALHPKKDKK